MKSELERAIEAVENNSTMPISSHISKILLGEIARLKIREDKLIEALNEQTDRANRLQVTINTLNLAKSGKKTLLDHFKRCFDDSVTLTEAMTDDVQKILAQIAYPECSHEIKCSKCGKKLDACLTCK